MAEAAPKANPNPTGETYAAPQANPKDIAPEVAARIAEQARSGNVRTGPNDTPDTTVNGERPAWLPENFKSPEEAMKSLKETQAELTRMKQEAAKAKGEPVKGTEPKKLGDLELPKADEEKPAEGAAEEAVTKAGFDMVALQKEFQEHGDITPESRTKLEKAGFTKEIVDSYIEGQKAIAERILNDLQVSVAGSPEKFNEMWAWSVRGIPDSEKAAINAALATNDPNVAKLAMSAVHAKWIAAVGQDPERVLHGTKTGGDADVYTHMDEVQKDMRNPEYQTNEAYRQKVWAKMKRSNI